MYTFITSLIQHYFEYLRSPAVLLTILIILGPIYLEVFKNYKLAPINHSARIPGCFRLGISKKSNLDDQHTSIPGEPTSDGNARVKALFTYPVKSCRGVELAASEVGTTGLKYDRLFTFAQLLPKRRDEADDVANGEIDHSSGEVEHEWRFITQREFPRLALIETELYVPRPKEKTKHDQARKRRKGEDAATSDSAGEDQSSWSANGGCLLLRFPTQPSFNPLGLRNTTTSVGLPLVPTPQRINDKNYSLEELSIWIDQIQAINITDEIPSDVLAKLKTFLGVKHPLGLFRVDHNNRREILRSRPRDREGETYSVGFADAFPFHLLNMASVRAQDGELPKASSLKGRLDARRFRANVYVTGTPAYDEDGWKKVTMGRCIQVPAAAPAKAKASAKSSQTMNGKQPVETDGEYHVACRTARCKLPNVDQDSGVRDPNEPLTTLGRTRKVDRGAHPHAVLGVQMIPLFQQGILRVGDEVRVLERGEHVYEKMFP